MGCEHNMVRGHISQSEIGGKLPAIAINTFCKYISKMFATFGGDPAD